MAAAYVQGGFAFIDNVGQASVAVTLGAAVGSGNAIGGTIKYGTATSVFNNITDDKGNTYTVVDTVTSASNTTKSFYAYNITNAPTVITANFTSSTGVYPRLNVAEGSGVDTTSGILAAHEGQTQNAPGNGTDIVTSGGVVSTSVSGSLILGFCIQMVSTFTNVAGTNFTNQVIGSTAPNNFDGTCIESRVQGSSGICPALWTAGGGEGTVEYTTMMLAFRPPQVGGNNSLTAPLGVLTLTGLIPSFTQGNSLTAPLGTMTLTGLIPSFTQGHSLTAPLGVMTLSGLIPAFVISGQTVRYVGLSKYIGLSLLSDVGLTLGVGGLSYEEDV